MDISALLRISVQQAAVILGLALLPAVVLSVAHPRRPNWVAPASTKGTEIDAATAKSMAKNVLFIDARPRAQYDIAHVPGALHLSEDRWDPSEVAARWNPDLTLIVYCGGESCLPSHDVAHRLRKEVGMPKVVVVSGGWDAWRKAGGASSAEVPAVKPGTPPAKKDDDGWAAPQPASATKKDDDGWAAPQPAAPVKHADEKKAGGKKDDDGWSPPK